MDEYLKFLSEKYNLPVYVIHSIIQSPFRMLTEEMNKQSLLGTKFLHIGKIALSDRKKDWVKRTGELERINEVKRLRREEKNGKTPE